MMASFEVLAGESYKELLNLLEWFSHFSLVPTLIGGWAVFIYNSYFGSVDIDVVGPGMGGHFLDCARGDGRFSILSLVLRTSIHKVHM